MEARGRKARVDEFFPSKKRRCSKSDSKSNSILTQGIGSPSPSKIGNLDDYLIATQVSDLSTSRQELVEIQDLDTPPKLETCMIRGVDVIAEGKGWAHNKTFSLQRCSEPSQTHSSTIDTLEYVTIQDKLQGGESNIVSAVDEFSRQSELDDFANDFLSICCSINSKASLPSSTSLTGLSTNDAQGIDVVRDTKNHKNVSLTCPIDEFVSKMKVHTDIAGSQIVYNGGMRESSSGVLQDREDLSTMHRKCSMKNSEYLASRFKENEPSNTNYAAVSTVTFESPKVGRESVTSSLSGEKRKTAITPRTSSGGRHKQTAKWSAGNSIFSPGDEFWDEAINLADALVCTNAETDLTEATHLKAGDKSLYNENVSVLPGNVGTALDDVQLNAQASFLIKNTHGRHNHGCADVTGPEISPLPVRRFDFTGDDKVLVGFEGSITCALADKTLTGESTNTKKIMDKFPNTVSGDPLVTEQHIGGEAKSVNGAATSVVIKQVTPNLSDHQAPQSVGLSISSLQDKKLVSGDYITRSEVPGNPSQNSSKVEKKLEFSNWLPAPVCSVYAKKGLKKLYPWQVECLQLDGVLDGRNLVYCASTSAGKSLVAEILMLRQVLSTGKKALLVLPYVSICSEKAEHLELLLEPMGKSVSSFFGTRGGASLPKDASIAICTIEKANSLINKLLEEGRLPELAVVVIDELHMVGDRDRGYLLELMLTKLRYAAGEGTDAKIKESLDDKGQTSNLQIIGMSATMPNAGAVASWLKAALYETDFRPVPLVEYIKVGNVIYNKQMEVVRTIRKNADLAGKDPDHVVELCNEIVQEGNSVLLFCSSRKACETSAKHVAKFLPAHDLTIRGNSNGPESAAAALEELQKSPSGLDPVLAETLPKGVAYHHAGLTVEEREMVELCYRSGIVRVLTATSTLAAGVNLPARRVIFRQPRIGRDFIDGTRYRQMAGRAGRAGIDTRGESILICKPEELKRINALLSEGCQPLLSCLAEDKNGMTRAILEVVAGGIVQSAKDVERYVKCTLLNSTQDFQDVVKSAQDSLHWLCHRKFLEWDTNLQLYNCTPLGKAAFGSSLSPEESLIVFEDLAKAREGFVLASDLHLVYQVTPIYVELEPDWSLYYKKFVELSPLDQAVGNRVGVMEPFLMRMAHGAPAFDYRSKKSPRRKGILSPVNRNGVKNSPTKAAEHTLRVCKRFYVSLMLAKLIQEAPLMDICESFKVARGMVQSLQEISGRFASMVSAFCERIGWHDMEGLVSKFQSRVSFGVRAEIVELAEIPYVKASRARALYKAGFRTPQAVAEATISELVKALFEFSSKGSEDGSRSNMQHRIQLGMARKIQNGARKLVFERAEEARVAAFSALCALGVDIPHALSKPLPQSCVLAGKESEGSEALTTIDMSMEKNESTNANVPTIMNPKLNEEFSLPSSYHNEQTLNVNCTLKEDVNLRNTGDSLNMGPVDVDNLNGGFSEFLSLTQDIREFFFDLHFTSGTDSSSPYFDVKGIAICWVNSPVYYVSLEDSNCSTEVSLQRWEKLIKMFSTEGLLKITWNWQSQVIAFKQPSIYSQPQQIDHRIAGIFEHGNSNKKITSLPPINAKEPVVDLRLAAWLLWPDEESAENVSLEQEIKKRLPGNIVAKANRDGRWVNQMGRVAHNGCCKRVSQIRALHSVIWKLLVSDGLDRALLQQEMPLVPILSEMESRGIRVDMDGCKSARQHLETKIKELESQAHVLAGVMFSLSVPAEVANVLYSHLKLPIPAGCQKGKKQHPSTDKQALDALKGQHPIVDVIKEHRTLSKVLNGTLGSILFKAKPFVSGNDQSSCVKSIRYYIKGHWLHTATSTGRLSMEEPNLQCVEHPLRFTIAKQSVDGKESEEYIVNPRDFFIPFQEEWVLLSADYSQIEVRLMAHLSGDSSLIELLSRPSGDLFKTITARWTGIAEDNVTAKQRENTKRLVYGILYGMGINALAEQLECSVPEASEIYNRFKAAFPSVAKWLKDAVQNCRERGYITTLAGRRRYLDKIKCGTVAERAKAERQAVNSICQGSAADLIKIAMVKLVSGSGKVSDPSSRPFIGRYNLLLQIHDELVLEVEKTVVHEVAKWLQSCMESAASLRVPLRVKLKSGPKWGSLQPLELT